MWILNSALGYRFIGALAALGIGVAGYLTYLEFSQAQSAFCLSGSSCDIVRSSSYAKIFGIPVALVGLVGYTALLALTLAPFNRTTKALVIFPGATVGFGFSVYLVSVQVFILGAICPWCMASFGLISGIFLIEAVLMIRIRRFSLGRLPAVFALSLLALGLVVLLAACSGSDKGSEGSYEAKLAQHLTEVGAVMYGAYWCPHCADQKKSFGDAFKYVQYVECDPGGLKAQPALCQSKGIAGYPTWEINGAFYEGNIPLETLARLSGS